jgi:hypothetical protein
LQSARAAVAMFNSNTNGNSAMFLVVNGKEQPLSDDSPPLRRSEPLPRIRQVMVPAETPASPSKMATAVNLHSTGAVPTLDELLVRWRSAKAGLKRSTEQKLDCHLTMLRRYVRTDRPVTDYQPQDLREFIAQARADKDDNEKRRLKGRTINESIWRPLHDAFALAHEENVIPRNPMASVKREKTEPINRSQHTWADAERILNEVKARTHESYLELKFMLFMGVGQAEARDFAGGSVDWQNKAITFIRRKTGQKYEVPLYPWAEDFIRAEMEPRLQDGKAVFDWRNPRKAMETACKKLHLAFVDIRSLRRTLIVRLLEQKMPPRLVAKWQGHKDSNLINTRYGNHIDRKYEEDALALLKKTAEK